jgi:tRNA dimethylallyltransferase
VRSTGHPLAHWQAQRTGGIGKAIALHPAILLPDRQWLYARCDRRFSAMLAGGAIEEVAALRKRQLDPALPVMRAIGVPEILDHLAGICPLEEAAARGAQATRNYVKRQLTWLRHQCPQDWPRIESEDFDAEILFESLLRH